MHTAGADGRQFHGLMADPRIVEHHRLISFDLPWHGKSPPQEGAIQGSWRLNTDLYVALIMGFIAAAGPQKPVALGASMSGEICLELAYRHPDSFAGIIACEACDKINQRQTVWAAHPHVNQAKFVPEWISGDLPFDEIENRRVTSRLDRKTHGPWSGPGGQHRICGASRAPSEGVGEAGHCARSLPVP